MSERLGLTDGEVKWLRAHCTTNETAKKMVALYQMVVACPRDPGARAVFSCMLADWRKEPGHDQANPA